MIRKLVVVFSFLVCSLTAYAADTALQQVLPLLQKNNRSAAENQTVLTLFRTAKNPDVVFAAGASLVKTPPAKAQEPALFNVLMRSQDGLKQTFAAVIITAMGSVHEELTPTLENALAGKDPVLRAYAAAAYALIKPRDTAYTQDIVRLYIFDPAFAERALNMQTAKAKNLFKILQKASTSDDEQVRAAAATWLGTLHTQDSAKQLLKMAKKETSPSVQAAIATGLAAQRTDTLDTVEKGLRKNYTSPYANTCALALGFMTGNGIDAVRKNLTSANTNARINASRAAAYMASVLSNPDAFAYSSDRVFDIHLLKGLIAPLKALEKSGDDTEKKYAANALLQIEKLME